MKKIVKTRDYKFVAVIKPAEEGGFYAYCPLLPGCAAQGENYAETVANIEIDYFYPRRAVRFKWQA